MSVDAARGADVADLRRWLDRSPTPYHCVDSAAAVLRAAGLVEVDGWSALPDSGFIVADGSLHAWRRGTGPVLAARLLGAHTDSPNLRLRPTPEVAAAGWGALGAEIYGGVLLNSWLDRDLGIAGRVVLRDRSVHLFDSAAAMARIPQLAIHLDREIGERGLQLDRQQHMRPVWSTAPGPDFVTWLAGLLEVDRGEILAHEAHLFDVQPSEIVGPGGDMLVSGRLDNQVSCWAAIGAIVDASAPEGRALMVSLHDHEEVGSSSVSGAASPLTGALLRVLVGGADESTFRDVMRRSLCLSMDNAHALHPNYPERHDPMHAPMLNRGPALKVNSNQRYATSVRGEAEARAVAEEAGVPLQTFVSRNNVPCGSTIGPISATSLGIDTIDVGVPQLSMHSAREVCGASDPGLLRKFATAFLDRA